MRQCFAHDVKTTGDKFDDDIIRAPGVHLPTFYNLQCNQWRHIKCKKIKNQQQTSKQRTLGDLCRYVMSLCRFKCQFLQTKHAPWGETQL